MVIPNFPHYIIQRGNCSQNVFLATGIRNIILNRYINMLRRLDWVFGITGWRDENTD